MQTYRSLIVALALAVTGCPASPDTDTDTAGETDEPDTGDTGDIGDTDDCPPGIDEQTFIDDHLRPMCAWILSCPDTDWPSVEFCWGRNSSIYLSVGGWDECAALDCVEWLDDAPVCEDIRDFFPRCDEVQPP